MARRASAMMIGQRAAGRLGVVLLALLAGVGPARAADRPIALAGYVAAPLRRIGNGLILEAVLNGHEIALQVDTGAPVTVLSEPAYRQYVPRGAERKLPGGIPREFNANGRPAFAGWIDSLRAGAMDFGSGPVAVTSLDAVREERYLTATRARRRVEGLLGADVLIRYAAIVDPARLVIYFNVDSARSGRPGPLMAGPGWTAIPMTISEGRHFCVPTRVSGRPLEVMVDTGANVTVFDAGRLAGLKLAARSINARGQVINLASAEVKALPLKNWWIGEFKIPAFWVGLTVLPPLLLDDEAKAGPVSGLLGADVLLSHHAIIDFGQFKLYLKAP